MSEDDASNWPDPQKYIPGEIAAYLKKFKPVDERLQAIQEPQMPPKPLTEEDKECLKELEEAEKMLPPGAKVTAVKATQSGTIVEYEPKGFVKHDAGKPRFSLVPAEARAELAKAFSHGAKKYPPNNFRAGTDWSRYVDALYRHVNAWELREDTDSESGLNHLAHAGACIMILLTLQLKGLGKDDRP